LGGSLFNVKHPAVVRVREGQIGEKRNKKEVRTNRTYRSSGAEKAGVSYNSTRDWVRVNQKKKRMG